MVTVLMLKDWKELINHIKQSWMLRGHSVVISVFICGVYFMFMCLLVTVALVDSSSTYSLSDCVFL